MIVNGQVLDQWGFPESETSEEHLRNALHVVGLLIHEHHAIPDLLGVRTRLEAAVGAMRREGAERTLVWDELRQGISDARARDAGAL